MAAKTLHDITRAGLNVLAIVIDSVTGLLTAQLGDVVKQTPSSSECEVYGPSGVIGIPQEPVAGSAAAEVVVIKGSAHDQIVGFRDARWAAIVNAVGLAYGETLVFSPSGGGYIVFRKDKSLQLVSGNGSIQLTLTENGDCNIGNDPVALALGSALNVVIQQVATLMGTSAENGSPPSTPAQILQFQQQTANYQTNQTNGT